MIQILRTFHIPTKEEFRTVDISETLRPDTLIIELGEEAFTLTREHFEALCALRFDIKWADDSNSLDVDEIFPEPSNV